MSVLSGYFQQIWHNSEYMSDQSQVTWPFSLPWVKLCCMICCSIITLLSFILSFFSDSCWAAFLFCTNILLSFFFFFCIPMQFPLLQFISINLISSSAIALILLYISSGISIYCNKLYWHRDISSSIYSSLTIYPFRQFSINSNYSLSILSDWFRQWFIISFISSSNYNKNWEFFVCSLFNFLGDIVSILGLFYSSSLYLRLVS